MKKLSKIICTVGVATASVGGAAGISRAHAATPAVNQYVHGSTAIARFDTYAACAPHAAWMKSLVKKNAMSHHAMLRAGEPANARAAYRTMCYPTASGQWSYYVFYTATAPLVKGDAHVATWVPGDHVNYFQHHIWHAGTQWSKAACDGALNSMVRKTIAGADIRLTSAPSSCTYENGWTYTVDYLGTSTRSGLYGDSSSLQWDVLSILS